ncbi:chemotaxis protein CheW [Eubacterium xylanophilum]|uniref:chemotaxis protein CheW n=1 Tax=Eubacterium xylanophilum TaxID=39497 RepID=UPI0004BA0717|nr:chemotaxis protein CheW [Eubacterium xylanophilum]MCR5797194.1 chemotaxis protein CheW [Eubacterium sp.]
MDEVLENQIEEEIQYIVINLDNEQYGINIDVVESIVRIPRITRVPRSQDYYVGVINLRGEVVPVMSLRKRFGIEEKEYSNATRIIILKLEDQSLVGIIVDQVSEVVNLEVGDIEIPNFKLDERTAGYLSGIGKYGKELISLLDIQNVVGEQKV